MASKETTSTADHRCTICGKTFDSEEELEAHVKDIGIAW